MGSRTITVNRAEKSLDRMVTLNVNVSRIVPAQPVITVWAALRHMAVHEMFAKFPWMKAAFVEKVAHALDLGAPSWKRNEARDLPAHLRTGQRGEDDAYFYLRMHGYVMVARNWRSPRHRGELDLVGWDGDVLCFIEVKTRTTRAVAPAEAAVDQQKRGDLIAVARDFLHRIKGNSTTRFDILSVYYDAEGESPDITLFKNAFVMP